MNRQQVAARIRALFSKTIENGATEAEAASAAAKAKELLDVYQLSMSELELEEEGTERGSSKNSNKRGHYDIKPRLSTAIAEFCEVQYWLTGKEQTVVYFGLKSDVDFAIWLTDSLESFVKKEADHYKLGNLVDTLAQNGEFRIPPLLEMNAFRAGCIDKIKERLRFEVAKRKEHLKTNSKNAVMVIKNALVMRKFRELGMHFGKAKMRGSHNGGSAYGAGQSAGNRASFGRPVAGGTLRIGKH
jgi:hypothetical protein